jgi:predicted nucleotidyltransferase
VEHHEASIAAFVTNARATSACDAVIVAGSVARGTERPDSDVDLYLLVGEQVFAQAREDGRLSYVTTDGITYEGGYFDIKLVTLGYLERAAVDGDDPCRASFEGAQVAWSTVDALDERIRRIVEPPQEYWEQQMRAFVTFARLQGG